MTRNTRATQSAPGARFTVAAAQFEIITNDVAHNLTEATAAYTEARQKGAEIVVLPRHAVAGPGNNVPIASIYAAETRLRELTGDGGTLIAARSDATIIVWRNGRQVAGARDRTSLDHSGAHIEVLAGVPTGSDPVATADSDLVIISDSDSYTDEAHQQRVAQLKDLTHGIRPVIWVNHVGGFEHHVYDGDTRTLNADGEVIARAATWVTTIVYTRVTRTGDHVTVKSDDKSTRRGDDEELYLALVTGIRSYHVSNRIEGAVVGLSGGIDSALVGALVTDALGPEHVVGISMPGPFSSTHSVTDAAQLAHNLGIELRHTDIRNSYRVLDEALANANSGWDDNYVNIAHQNVQARLRGTIAMAVANQTGRIVCATGNKTEAALGYATLYGDTVGGYAPIIDVYKGSVYRLANWRNQLTEQRAQRLFGAYSVAAPIPQNSIDKAPSAELAPGQRDEKELASYDLADAIVAQHLTTDNDDDTIARLVGAESDVVAKLRRRIDASEYKRRQVAIGPRVTTSALGHDWNHPLTARSNATQSNIPH